MRTLTAVLFLVLGASSCATKPLLDEQRLIDLTHPLDDANPHLPGDTPFVYERTRGTRDEFGRWQSQGQFAMSEQVGTHLIAPLHLGESMRATHEIALTQLVAPIRLIDVSSACRQNRDYVVGIRDLSEHERDHGRLPIGAAVLVRLGWERHWDNPRRFLGLDDAQSQALHFPGLSLELVRELIERRVDLVAVDGPRLDPGQAVDLAASRALAEANVPALACLTNLGELPDFGATLIALPLKIAGGNGSPARVIALVP